MRRLKAARERHREGRLASDSRRVPALAAGDAVMAFGIFGLAALPQLPGVGPGGLRLFALAQLALWAALALAYARSIAGVRRQLRDPFARFGVGTWVAGTGVTGELLVLAWPQLAPLALGLLVIAALLWLWLLGLAAAALPALLARPHRGRGGTSIVLLATVATQALVLLLHALLPLPRAAAAVLIAFGGLLYAGALALVVARYARSRDPAIAAHGSTTNCIVHGALSITGLALATTAAAAPPLAVGLWLLTALLFVLVEAAELRRLALRVRRLGWARGALGWRVSQWVRNFTFGMFYAFTLALATAPQARAVAAGLGLGPPMAAIVRGGAFVVLGLLLIETLLWARSRRRRAGPG